LALFGHDRRLAVPILLEFLRAPIGVGSVTAQASAAFALRQLGRAAAVDVRSVQAFVDIGAAAQRAVELGFLLLTIEISRRRKPAFEAMVVAARQVENNHAIRDVRFRSTPTSLPSSRRLCRTRRAGGTMVPAVGPAQPFPAEGF